MLTDQHDHDTLFRLDLCPPLAILEDLNRKIKKQADGVLTAIQHRTYEISLQFAQESLKNLVEYVGFFQHEHVATIFNDPQAGK